MKDRPADRSSRSWSCQQFVAASVREFGASGTGFVGQTHKTWHCVPKQRHITWLPDHENQSGEQNIDGNKVVLDAYITSRGSTDA
jgi:hypothetical protein